MKFIYNIYTGVEMKKIDIEERLIDEIFNEMKQEELEEYEKTLGGE